jgi:uncharacterized protein YybS (DUF2232 family)
VKRSRALLAAWVFVLVTLAAQAAQTIGAVFGVAPPLPPNLVAVLAIVVLMVWVFDDWGPLA